MVPRITPLLCGLGKHSFLHMLDIDGVADAGFACEYACTLHASALTMEEPDQQ